MSSLNRLLRFALPVLAFLFIVSPSLARQLGLDATFGDGGVVITNAGTNVNRAFGVTSQADGRIIVVGDRLGTGDLSDILVLRYLADGTLDASFGGSGIVSFDPSGSLSDTAVDVAVQDDGKIVVTGRVEKPGANGSDVLVMRLNTDGSLDEAFGTGGIVRLQAGDDARPTDIRVLDDGRILVVGDAVTSTDNILLARFESDGSLDATFATDGVFMGSLGVPAGPEEVVLQADGRIVIAATDYSDPIEPDPMIVRFTADGALDTGFGSNGATIVRTNGRGDGAASVVIADDGSMVLTGWISDQDEILLAYFDQSGMLNTEFGNQGVVEVDLGFRVSNVPAWIMPDGKILLAGRTNGANKSFAIGRVMSDGAVDASFGTNGSVLTGLDGITPWDATIQPDGKLVMTGYADVGAFPVFALDIATARFDAGIPTAVEQIASELPDGFTLEQNYPNPFNPSTNLRFSLPEAADARVAVFDVSGREIAVLANRRFGPGNWEIGFDATGLASGVYLARMDIDGHFAASRRMVLLK